MKRILLAAALAYLPLLGLAQCYEAYPIPYAPYPYDQGTSVSLTDDTHSDTIDIGFNFCFFGDSVSRLVIASNGYITFTDSLAQQPSSWGISDSIPYETSPKFCIMAPWQDLNPGAGGAIYFETFGTAPYRKSVVSYFEVAMFSCTVLEFTNQIVLYESSNAIDINIKEKELCTTWNGGAAVEGIINQDGTEAVIVPGRNFPEQWEASNDAWRFTPICSCPSVEPPSPLFVSGVVYDDINSDCEFSANEPTIPNVRLNILPNNIDVFSNANGSYALPLDSGEYYITQSPLNEPYLNYTCTGNYIPFQLNNAATAEEINLGNETFNTEDLSVSIASTALAFCQQAIQTVQICNLSSEPKYDVSASVTLQNPIIEYHPDSTGGFIIQADSILTISIDSLGSFECLAYQLYGTVTCDSSQLEATTCFLAQVEYLGNELVSENNSAITCQEIQEPVRFRKTVQSVTGNGIWRTQEFIESEDELVYRIDFTNLGSASIHNLRIVDTLSGYLNHSLIDVLISSHEYFMSYNDSVLTFDFFNIELPSVDSAFGESQLYVVFRVLQWPGNPVGTIINNRAYLSIESSFPQPTNKTRNEIRDFSSINEITENELTLYPNPTTGELLISNPSPHNSINGVDVLDTQGRLLLRKTDNGISKIDLGELNTGVYLIRIETEKGTMVRRVIRN